MAMVGPRGIGRRLDVVVGACGAVGSPAQVVMTGQVAPRRDVEGAAGSLARSRIRLPAESCRARAARTMSNSPQARSPPSMTWGLMTKLDPGVPGICP